MVAAELIRLRDTSPSHECRVLDDGKIHTWANGNGPWNAEQALFTPVLDLRHGFEANDRAIRQHGIRVVSFATPLKAFCMDVLGLTREQCYGTNAQKETYTRVTWDGLPFRVRWKYRKRWFRWLRSGEMTAREVMQVFGTDVIRVWHPDAWAVAAYNFARATKEDVVFVPDCRFPNEVERRDVVEDECYVYTARLLRAAHDADPHPSETALDDYPLERFDLWVREEATLDDMRSHAGRLAERLMEIR